MSKANEGFTRRDFLKGTGVAATAVVATGLVGCAGSGAGTQAAAQIEWDRETEVLVLGFGGAGAVSAVTAHEEGADVLILEKAPKEGGGTTRISTGYSSIVLDPDGALEYLHHQVKGLTPDEVFEAYVQEGATLVDWLDDHGLTYTDVSSVLGPDYKNWPGSDAFGAVGFTNEDGVNSGTAVFDWATAYMQDNGINDHAEVAKWLLSESHPELVDEWLTPEQAETLRAAL